MKKPLVIIIALALVAGIICSIIFIAPNCGGIEDSADVLYIDLLEAGYGTDFCYEIKRIFEEQNPGKTVEITSSRTIQLSTENKILAGPKRNNVDLFITSYSDFRSLVSRGPRAVKGYDVCVEDLSSLYESVDENGVKIKDKLDKSYTDYVTMDGKYYAVPWASGPCGFMYNKTLFDYFNWEIPKTVSDLEDLCEQINSERDAGTHGVYPIVYGGYSGSSYWSYVYNTWHAQYEGYDNYRAFWEGGLLKEDGTYDYSNGYLVYRQEGRLESLKALDRILGNEAYIMPGSSGFDHTTAQSELLLGRAAIMPTGDWVENEMKTGENAGVIFKCDNVPGSPLTEIDYLSTPLLDVVASWAEYEGQTGIDEETGLDKSELYQRYLNASKYAFSIGFQHLAIMPSYSNAKDLAYKFLKLMVSDNGCNIFLEKAGSPSPFKMDYTDEELDQMNLSSFQKSKAQFARDTVYITKFEMSPIRYKASLSNYTSVQPESAIPAGTSPKSLFDSEATYVQSMWNSFLISAGLVKVN